MLCSNNIFRGGGKILKKFFGYLFLVFGMAFALSYFQNSSVNALDGSYDDAIMGQSSHIDQDENKIEDAKEENSYSLRTMIQNGGLSRK